jgi:hypothetical protein
MAGNTRQCALDELVHDDELDLCQCPPIHHQHDQCLEDLPIHLQQDHLLGDLLVKNEECCQDSLLYENAMGMGFGHGQALTDYEQALAREHSCACSRETSPAHCRNGAVSTSEENQLTLWSKDTACSVYYHTLECVQLLKKSFLMWELDADSSLSCVLREVKELYNYEVVQVVRLQNRKRLQMWRYFSQCYEILKHRTVFHGTTSTGAMSIASSGFRGAACHRSLWGRGIYTSTSVWEALCYAKPEGEDMTQTFIVADFWQGPTALGKRDQLDFGCNQNGCAVLTLTNPEGTVQCASHENQLLATYKITVRYLSERPMTPSHHNRIRMYHPEIWDRIKGKPCALQQMQGIQIPLPLLPATARTASCNNPGSTASTVTTRPKSHGAKCGTGSTTPSLLPAKRRMATRSCPDALTSRTSRRSRKR